MPDSEFRDDLLIVTFDKQTNKKTLFLIPSSTWKAEQFKLDEDSNLGAFIEPMLNAGCALATVPTTNIQEGGASCYLVSLPSLNVDPFGRNEEAVHTLAATHAASAE